MTFLKSNLETPGPIHHRVNYLRISVTDRCNLACRYCVPKDHVPTLSHKDIARYEEILKIVRISRDLGVTKVRITGGEPLVRKGVLEFIQEVAGMPGIEDVSMTTNGVLLRKNAHRLKGSGIKRLNISLDTLKPERFRFITGKNLFKEVWGGIMAAHDRGLTPIKLNAVIMGGVNDDEIEDLVALTLDYPFHVRFIEYMPMGNSKVNMDQQVLIPEIKQRIETAFGPLAPVARGLHDGPAKRFKLADAPGEVGFISPLSSHFCHECNRLRLTSTGNLRPCLLNAYEHEILPSLRRGASDHELKEIIMEAVRRKPASHTLITDAYPRVTSQMFTIGG
ncbi:MAG: GTP 3',8-cyclase MoaA [Desulfobacterium sp.]|nr:GTP 3',8-cyclase MoaA [Desulfobacterium sp.]